MTGRRPARLALSAIPLLVILIPLFRLPVNVVIQAQEAPAQQTDVEGDLEVEVEDSLAGSRIHHFVRVNGKRLRLRSGNQLPMWQSGTKVRERGRLANNELQLSDSGSVQVLALATPNTFGQQRVAVILVNFQNNMATPYAASTAQTITFRR
jgi:hypothetical protein